MYPPPLPVPRCHPSSSSSPCKAMAFAALAILLIPARRCRRRYRGRDHPPNKGPPLPILPPPRGGEAPPDVAGRLGPEPVSDPDHTPRSSPFSSPCFLLAPGLLFGLPSLFDINPNSPPPAPAAFLERGHRRYHELFRPFVGVRRGLSAGSKGRMIHPGDGPHRPPPLDGERRRHRVMT